MNSRRTFLRYVGLAAAAARMRAQAPPAAPTAPDAPMTIEDLAVAYRILASQGVFDAYGHVTMRNPANPQRYFMSRSVAPELVQAEDILEFDLDSNMLGSKKAAPFIERFIHGAVYQARPDVNAVLHCHTPSLIPFGVTGVPLKAVFGNAGFVAEGVPVFEIRTKFGMTDLLISDAARGKALAETLGQKPAALLRGHGAVVTGPTLPIAVGRAVYLDLNARMQAQAMQQGGKGTYLEPEEGKISVADGYRRPWELWKRKAEGK